ncbi:uncharacterized protein LOC142908353 [Petromyzon marinus]|uniref:uncharacterized protein LOC142908353 n=1 Tax=Petromyzon marinus TaxID=7757 RepID=UPI003F704E2F
MYGSSVPPASSAQAAAVSLSARSRYGLRQRERKVYTEVEEPQDDDFFWREGRDAGRVTGDTSPMSELNKFTMQRGREGGICLERSSPSHSLTVPLLLLLLLRFAPLLLLLLLWLSVCELCRDFYLGECSVHGPPEFIADAAVTPGVADRARLSLPQGLTVGASSIAGAGLGVWSNRKKLPKGVMFGPYQGEVSEENPVSEYCWLIYKNKKDREYVDAQDESKSNWMRFVNCARNEQEQNLVAFQHRGQIYYRTFRAVGPGSELLVWYGEEFAQELGIACEAGPSRRSSSSSELAPRATARDLQPVQPPPSEEHCEHRSPETHHCSPHTHTRVQECSCLGVGVCVLCLWDDAGGVGVEVTRLPCPACNRQFICRSSLEHHVQKRHAPKPSNKSHHCDQCPYSTDRKSSLKIHQRTHTGEKPFKCTVCEKAFAQLPDLHRHQRTHTGEKPFKCTVCEKAFADPSTLHSHQRTHTGEKPFKCTVCEKAFAQLPDLHRHQRTHTGEKPFKCTVCEKAFAQLPHLHSHQRTHTGEKPFKCTVCEKAFARLSTLHSHQRTHTGEKPFKCTVCEKAFARPSTLHSHQRTHTGEKPFKCTVCEKAFADPSSLHSHQRTHTGEKPFKCTVSEKAFARPSTLHSHQRTHTGEKPFKCTVCEKAFARPSTLHSHQRTHTGQNAFSHPRGNRKVSHPEHKAHNAEL